MSEHVHTKVRNGTGFITLDRPKALNSLTLDMVRTLSGTLLAWRDDDDIAAVVVRSTTEKALCAGGDIRFFHAAGTATPQGGVVIASLADARALLAWLLAIAGAYDEAKPIVWQPFVDAIPDVRSHVFKESSHMPHVEEPEAFTEVVGSFLREHDRDVP